MTEHCFIHVSNELKIIAFIYVLFYSELKRELIKFVRKNNIGNGVCYCICCRRKTLKIKIWTRPPAAAAQPRGRRVRAVAVLTRNPAMIMRKQTHLSILRWRECCLKSIATPMSLAYFLTSDLERCFAFLVCLALEKPTVSHKYGGAYAVDARKESMKVRGCPHHINCVYFKIEHFVLNILT